MQALSPWLPEEFVDEELRGKLQQLGEFRGEMRVIKQSNNHSYCIESPKRSVYDDTKRS